MSPGLQQDFFGPTAPVGGSNQQPGGQLPPFLQQLLDNSGGSGGNILWQNLHGDFTPDPSGGPGNRNPGSGPFGDPDFIPHFGDVWGFIQDALNQVRGNFPNVQGHPNFLGGNGGGLGNVLGGGGGNLSGDIFEQLSQFANPILSSLLGLMDPVGSLLGRQLGLMGTNAFSPNSLDAFLAQMFGLPGSGFMGPGGGAPPGDNPLDPNNPGGGGGGFDEEGGGDFFDEEGNFIHGTGVNAFIRELESLVEAGTLPPDFIQGLVGSLGGGGGGSSFTNPLQAQIQTLIGQLGGGEFDPTQSPGFGAGNAALMHLIGALDNPDTLEFEGGLPGQQTILNTIPDLIQQGFGNNLLGGMFAGDLQPGAFDPTSLDMLTRGRDLQGLTQIGLDWILNNGLPGQQDLLNNVLPQQIGNIGRFDQDLFNTVRFGGGPQNHLQQQLQHNLIGQLQGGGLTPEFVSAQRDLVLRPQMESLDDRLNQLGGGNADPDSPLFQELQRRQENDFSQGLTSFGFQNLGRFQDQAAGLGSQFFNQQQNRAGILSNLGQQDIGNALNIFQTVPQTVLPFQQLSSQLGSQQFGQGLQLQNQNFQQQLQQIQSLLQSGGQLGGEGRANLASIVDPVLGSLIPQLMNSSQGASGQNFQQMFGLLQLLSGREQGIGGFLQNNINTGLGFNQNLMELIQNPLIAGLNPLLSRRDPSFLEILGGALGGFGFNFDFGGGGGWNNPRTPPTFPGGGGGQTCIQGPFGFPICF